MKIKKAFIRFSRKFFGISTTPPKKNFPEKIKVIVERKQGFRCRGCNNPLKKHKGQRVYHFDHIHRRNDISVLNCQALCPTCHQYKTINDTTK